ncbi:MAG TPA: type II toxin-antitoxin system death-on-curing family toxin [Candidatus Nanoarchaeia archaeon]|nr:type II toxin-antitoxin system death-on-curing family toxin [Candidatus Nanoarchaeia archaeon]
MSKTKVTKEFIQETAALVSRLHDTIIEQSGGTKGVRDEGGLYHSVYKIVLYQEEYSEDPASVGALVYEEFARKHHFNDGNKRTAHAVAKLILFLINYHLKIEYKNAVSFIIEIAKYQSAVSTSEIKEWIKNNLIPTTEKNVESYLKEIVIDITRHEN